MGNKGPSRLAFSIDTILEERNEDWSQQEHASFMMPRFCHPFSYQIPYPNKFSIVPKFVPILNAESEACSPSSADFCSFNNGVTVPAPPPYSAAYSKRAAGHAYQGRVQHNVQQKKPRTSFTKQQICVLERRFAEQKYLSSSERAPLALALQMHDAQVKTWFQNRRTKWRRQEAEEREFANKLRRQQQMNDQ